MPLPRSAAQSASRPMVNCPLGMLRRSSVSLPAMRPPRTADVSVALVVARIWAVSFLQFGSSEGAAITDGLRRKQAAFRSNGRERLFRQAHTYPQAPPSGSHPNRGILGQTEIQEVLEYLG